MKKEKYIEIENLTVSENLYSFVNKNLLPGTGIGNSDFWNGFNKNIHELASKNKLVHHCNVPNIPIQKWVSWVPSKLLCPLC